MDDTQAVTIDPNGAVVHDQVHATLTGAAVPTFDDWILVGRHIAFAADLFPSLIWIVSVVAAIASGDVTVLLAVCTLGVLGALAMTTVVLAASFLVLFVALTVAAAIHKTLRVHLSMRTAGALWGGLLLGAPIATLVWTAITSSTGWSWSFLWLTAIVGIVTAMGQYAGAIGGYLADQSQSTPELRSWQRVVVATTLTTPQHFQFGTRQLLVLTIWVAVFASIAKACGVATLANFSALLIFVAGNVALLALGARLWPTIVRWRFERPTMQTAPSHPAAYRP